MTSISRRAARCSVPWLTLSLLLAAACDGTQPVGPDPDTEVGTGGGDGGGGSTVAFVDFPRSVDPLTSGQAFKVSGAAGASLAWSVRGAQITAGGGGDAISVVPEAGARYVVVQVTATTPAGVRVQAVDSTPIARRVTTLEGGTYGVAVGPNNRLASMLWLSGTVRFRTGRGDPAPLDVTTGDLPVHGVFSNNGQTFYVVEQNGLALRKIDTESGATTAVDYGRTLFNIALSPVDGMVYVTTYEGWLYKADPVTLQKLDSLDLGGPSNGLAINADGFWVATMNGALLKVDPVSLDLLDTITLGGVPQRVALDATATTAYVANEGGAGLQVVDLATHTVTSVAVAGTPYGVALAPGGQELWVAVRDAGRIDQFDTKEMALTGSLTIGGVPRNIAFSANGHVVLIGNETSSVLVER